MRTLGPCAVTYRAPDTPHRSQIRVGAVYHGGAGTARITRINSPSLHERPTTLTKVVFGGRAGRCTISETVGTLPNRSIMQAHYINLL